MLKLCVDDETVSSYCVKKHAIFINMHIKKHAIPKRSGALTFYPLDCQIKKNDNSEHNSSCLVWMNQNYIYFLSDNEKYIFGVLQNFRS